ncbi:hypothetical protein [Streptomyces sp. NPDC101115]|uniref:hypothetical protein n=1 Tax=Streptomyces sp. NPDC101115 TaxID=3366106 RepID=UPI003825E25A
MTTTATQLQTIARLWPALDDALGDRTQHAWPPPSLRGYLDALSRHDASEAAALRALERNPEQLGARPVPINLAIVDTMHKVEAALHETATQIAAANQLGAHTSHPHRWSFTGRPPGAAWTALWLSARASGVFWPGRALSEPQERHLGHVAAEALNRVESALDLADGCRELTSTHACACGGTIELRGGAGAAPRARCKGCGAYWTENGVIAA